jgi:hypothetical protein
MNILPSLKLSLLLLFKRFIDILLLEFIGMKEKKRNEKKPFYSRSWGPPQKEKKAKSFWLSLFPI